MKALILLLALIACGPPPKPFEHAPGLDNPLLTMESASVVVGPIDGVEPSIAAMLENAMVGALSKEDVPAVPFATATESQRRRTAVRGEINQSRTDQGQAHIALTWTMVDGEGVELWRRIYEMQIDPRAWERAALDDIAPLIGDAPKQFASMVNDDPGQAKEPPPPPMVRILPVTGAPGTGGAELTGAMAGLMRLSGLEISGNGPHDPAPDFLIAGKVETVSQDALTDLLRVAWSVQRPDGKELGVVDLGNPVPKAQITGTWGALAVEIARGSAEGVVKIINRYPPERK